MKKYAIILVILMLLSFTACSNESANTDNINSQSDSESLAQDSDNDAEIETDNYENVDTDVDLTVLSATMVYAEVYNMLVNPEDYFEKTVKMDGQFAIYEDTSTGIIYFAVIIMDATACCSQGIEFVLADQSYVYPDDYPEIGSEVVVSGIFETYEENGYTYCRLREAVFS